MRKSWFFRNFSVTFFNFFSKNIFFEKISQFSKIFFLWPDFDNSFFVMQLRVSTFDSRTVYYQQSPDGKVTRGETMNSRKNKEKTWFWRFLEWNFPRIQFSPTSGAPISNLRRNFHTNAVCRCKYRVRRIDWKRLEHRRTSLGSSFHQWKLFLKKWSKFDGSGSHHRFDNDMCQNSVLA